MMLDMSSADIRPVVLATGREVGIWCWEAIGPARGTIAFSHGAGSAPWKYLRLIAAWREAGYAVQAPLHVDSVDHPHVADHPGLASWKARIEDMRALSQRIDRPHVTAGHSYGALTALVMGGAAGVFPEGLSAPLHDGRTRCVIALSPPPPIPGLMTPEGYAGLAVPSLIQTGTHDQMPGWPETPEGWRVHLPAYEAAAPGGDRYLLVLDQVDHYFGNAIGEPDRAARPQDAALAQAISLSLLFLDTHFPAHSAAAAEILAARLTEDGPARLSRK